MKPPSSTAHELNDGGNADEHRQTMANTVNPNPFEDINLTEEHVSLSTGETVTTFKSPSSSNEALDNTYADSGPAMNGESNLGASQYEEHATMADTLSTEDGIDTSNSRPDKLDEEFSFKPHPPFDTSTSFDFNKVDVDNPFANHDNEDPFGDFTTESAFPEGNGNDDDWGNFGDQTTEMLVPSDSLAQTYEPVEHPPSNIYSAFVPLLQSSIVSESDITDAVVNDLNSSGFGQDTSQESFLTDISSLCDRARYCY